MFILNSCQPICCYQNICVLRAQLNLSLYSWHMPECILVWFYCKKMMIHFRVVWTEFTSLFYFKRFWSLKSAWLVWQLVPVSLYTIFVEKEMCQECPSCLSVWVCVLRVPSRAICHTLACFYTLLYLLNSKCMHELVNSELLESVMVWCTPGMRLCICEHVHVCKCIWPWMNSSILYRWLFQMLF